MDQGNPDALLGTIAERAELLRALRSGAKSKGTLTQRLPDSRSTIDRAVRDLESAGLLVQGTGQVELTLAGELIFEEYERLTDGISGVTKAHGLLESLPATVDLDPAVFSGAEVVSQSEHVPQGPVTEFKALLEGAEQIRGVSGIILPDHVDLYSRQITQDGMQVDLVVPDEILGTLLTEYREALLTSLDTGQLQLRVVDETPPFSALLTWHDEPVLAIIVYGEAGRTGVIRNTSDAAIAWGREWISTWESRAEPVPKPISFEG